MTSPVFFRDKHVWPNNRQFGNLLAWALEVGADLATQPIEKREVERLRSMYEHGEFWPGRGLRIENDFSGVEVLKFWAKVFRLVAHGIFEGSLGNRTVKNWQVVHIYLAYSVSQLLIEAVWETDHPWHPETDEAEDPNNGLTTSP